MKTLHLIQEPPRPAPARWALWDLGFRPFYLLASAFAALSVGLWALQFGGHLPSPYLAGPLWHAHEMLFGFTLAVIVGFLFTAGRNWTGRATPTGPLLAALAALWLAARVLLLTPYAWAAALANVAFPLACAAALAVPFVGARNRRNYFFVALLAALGAAAAVIHLDRLGLLGLPAWLGVQLALDVVLFILAVMGGRVIPMFTNSGVPGAGARRIGWLDRLALGTVLAVLAVDALQVPPLAAGFVFAIAGLAHAARWSAWKPWRTGRQPLVWVLHLGYAWIPLHLLLRALAAWGVVAPSLATHALTVGAVGGLVIGMMTRTAKGHTARPLRADRWDVAAYACIAAAAAVRIAMPLAWPAQLLPAVTASALLWSAGFAIYFVRYWPVLTRSRLDGQPG
jgi:uncharacterized protein involved in response to NO